MGSVKDLIVLQAPTREYPGRGRFIFSDRYSVFDWGEMPDYIEKKGAALCIASAYFFEKLEKEGIPTHYLGLVEDDQVKSLSQIHKPVSTLENKLFRVLYPELKDNNKYDYKVYFKEKGNYLIPLEIIYRNSLPEGSSIFKRLREGVLKPEDLGLTEMPDKGIDLNTPYLDVSTKLESRDRYLTWQEAQNISQLTEEKIGEINALTLKINQMISKEAKRVGLKNEDGKFEFALDHNQKVVLVDALGTLDECRFTYRGIPVSKEIARLYYRGSNWYQEVVKAKEKGDSNWKQFVKIDPDPLPPRLKTLISHIYCAFTNEIIGEEWFKEIPSLNDILQEIQEFIKI